jgi:TetR/AcrR family transcriptional regulator
MSRPKRTDPSDRRAQILDRAERLFAEHGYHGAALADIARAAGLGNAGLIHHFPGKASLYRAVLERVAAELDALLAAALVEAQDPGARLRVFVQVQAHWARDRPLACCLVQRELIDNRDRIASAHVLPLRGFVAKGKIIIEEAQAVGLVAPGSAEVKLCLVIGALAYGAIVRPTFRQMLRNPVLRTDSIWLDAIAEDLLGLLVGPGNPPIGSRTPQARGSRRRTVRR